MSLRTKSLLLHLVLTATILGLVLVFLHHRLNEDLRATVTREITGQLEHIERYLDAFFQNLDADLETLLAHPVVRTREDERFTSFLNANPDAFEYHYSPTELMIIRLFNDYRIHHPIVSSVYMGRENGTFVRSHPRASPTAYDPRERPWYQLARSHPGKTVRTEPYPSVTTSDINIGIVRAMLDESGEIIGVIGMDVTLNHLTDYLANIRFQPDGHFMLVDTQGTVLVSPDKRQLFTSIGQFSQPLADALLVNPQGIRSLVIGQERFQVVSRPILSSGWTAMALVPDRAIQKTIRHSLVLVLGTTAAGLMLLSVLALLGLNRFVILPIRHFSEIADEITHTQALDRRVTVTSRDEIGALARSWNAMLASLHNAHDALTRKELELIHHRDQLEITVQERTAELFREKERAEASDRIKSAFLATMSHELRTPLNSIIGFTGIILKGLVGPLNEEQTKQMGMVKVSAQHLLALINDVLDISKIEAGELRIIHEPYDLGAVLEKVILEAMPLAQKKGLQLTSSIEGDIPPMHGDARRLEQVLLNLVSNAIKFTETGSVTVCCRPEPGQMVIEVIDTGIGIKEADLVLLFKAFQQIDTGLSRKYEGTGLGLSISQKLVQMMGEPSVSAASGGRVVSSALRCQ